MMLCYAGLAKLKTKPIVYQYAILAGDLATLEALRELSSKRQAMEESTNESSHITEAIAREMSGGLTSRCEQEIQKLERYLPLLENLIRHFEKLKIVSWIPALKITWSSVLASSPIFRVSSTKLYQVNDLYFELGMSHFLYCANLRERALEVLPSDLVQSATLFRKAAGVFYYSAERIPNRFGRIEERPPEATPWMSSVMALICLADAQAVTARKAEENNSTSSLLSKLHCGVIQLLVEAADQLQPTSKCRDTTPRLLDYISSCKAIHKLTCYRHFADSLKNEGKIGVAIGVLRQAIAQAKKMVPKEDSWRSSHKQTLEQVMDVVRKYEHENDFVWNDKVPSEDELPQPQGVQIVYHIPYQPQYLDNKLTFKLAQ